MDAQDRYDATNALELLDHIAKRNGDEQLRQEEWADVAGARDLLRQWLQRWHERQETDDG